MYKIEFIDGEPFARVNGNLCTDEWWASQTGIPEYDIVFDDDFIYTESALYVKDFNVSIILRAIATYHAPLEEYDMVSSRGYGFNSYHQERDLLGTQGAYVVKGDCDLDIKPLAQFKKDFPKFNKKKYLELEAAFNEYYKR